MELFKQLRNEYLQGKPPGQSKILKTLLNKTTEEVFKYTLGYKYLPPIQYRILYVQYIIKQLEEMNQYEEELEEFYNYYEKISKEENLFEPFYKLYNISENENTEIIIKIYENNSTIVSNGTTGLVTWEASHQFIKWFQNAQIKFNWAIELGCGCGFLAISILKLCNNNNIISKYIVTDGSEIALIKCRENFKINFDNVNPMFKLLDWKNDLDKFISIINEFTKLYGTGYLIGADLIFDPELIPHLMKFIFEFIKVQNQIDNPGKVILSCTVRNELTFKQLQTHLDSSVVYSWNNGFILQA